MFRTRLRCPTCASIVILEANLDAVAAACLGCSRRWERRPAALAQRGARAARTHSPGRPKSRHSHTPCAAL